jgi:hypothetical protein
MLLRPHLWQCSESPSLGDEGDKEEVRVRASVAPTTNWRKPEAMGLRGEGTPNWIRKPDLAMT